MEKDFSKIYTIYFNALSHKLRTPISVIQNNLSYMKKSEDLSDCDTSLKKVSELTNAISNLHIEVNATKNAINISKLEDLELFNSNPSFFDSAFRETKIFLDFDAFNKLINYYDSVARDKFKCASLVIEGLVENGNPVLNIVYDSPKFSNMSVNEKYTYLSFLTKEALGLDVLSAALYDLNSGSFNLSSKFSLSKESLSLNIKFLSECIFNE